jgi:hypothetical protein
MIGDGEVGPLSLSRVVHLQFQTCTLCGVPAEGFLRGVTNT